ncbi:MAG: hypothetical protein JOY76_10225 [Hyphomicrobiales bacterium]|nr:hypothetical protein [Hyphomicrobiales bacterium]
MRASAVAVGEGVDARAERAHDGYGTGVGRFVCAFARRGADGCMRTLVAHDDVK